MITAEKIKQIEQRDDRIMSESILPHYKVYGDKNVKHVRVPRNNQRNYSQVFERDPYSQRQNFLYKRALFGLKMYPPEEIKEMNSKKRRRIKAVHQRTQGILNTWKQCLVTEWTNALFKALFPKSPMTKQLLECTETDGKFKDRKSLSFKDLGIGKAQIIDKLISEGALPHNFKTLK